MYKFLLSWRYLLTRYIAYVSVISMTLGVATMIIVNAVMLGFTNEMEKRIRGMTSDIVFEVASRDGIPDPDAHMAKIRQIAGDRIEGMSPTVITFALLSWRFGDEYRTEQVQLVGIDCNTQGGVSDMKNYLQHPENREQISFLLKRNGYDVTSTQKSSVPHVRPALEHSGWDYRRTSFAHMERIRKQNDSFRRQKEAADHAQWLARQQQLRDENSVINRIEVPTQEDSSHRHTVQKVIMSPSDGSEFDFEFNGTQSDEPSFSGLSEFSEMKIELPADDPFHIPSENQAKPFDPARQQHTGVILGMGFAMYRSDEAVDETTGKKIFEDFLILRPGDDVTLMFPTAGRNPRVAQDAFTIVDLMETRMTEHDDRLVFMPIEHLQKLRGMYDPSTGMTTATQILIKAKPGVDLDELKKDIQDEFSKSYPILYMVQTWKDMHAPLLSAVFTEVAMLNVLLFLIFAVAGFGILAIFFMIVVEKAKDIGILKSLGASGNGIMQIYVFYSLTLGILGSVIGIGLGLLFVAYIKEIAEVLAWFMGHSVFDPRIYSFSEIPTIVKPWTVCWIVCGAIFIAVCSGVLPALRAARMRPVESLRQ